ncbi:MAG: hypothetical protein J1F64_01045 [Oscillospiraceae bacterium]|nr:hypothetical protein [Oscillospiraceae bacterium]
MNWVWNKVSMNGKERLKSMLLGFLVICSLVLGGKIWTQKKLWPDGYNFFYSIKKSPIVRRLTDRKASPYTKTHIALPDRIIINTGYQTTRFLLNSTHEQFKMANDIAYEALAAAFSADSKNISEASSDEWYNTLTSRSVYLSYDINYSSDIMPEFFGCSGSAISGFTDIISDVVISGGDMGVSVIFKNGSSNRYYRVNAVDFDRSGIDELIVYFQDKFDENDTSSSTIINYSFDLLFDKAKESQRVIISPMVPIFNNPVEYETINSENPTARSDGTHNSQTVKELLDIFDINSNTMRKYTEADGTSVFVENDMILKLSPGGYLTYTSKNPQRSILKRNAGSVYDAVSMVSEFTDRINDISGSNKDLYISSDLTDMDYAKSKITFDYIVNGIPVTMTETEHAVEVFVENGYITEYRQILRRYENTSVITSTPMYISAIDSVSDNGSENKYTVVEKMYVSYFDDLSIGEKTADWRLITSELERS